MEEKKSIYALPKDCEEMFFAVIKTLPNGADAVPDKYVSHLRKCDTCLEWAYHQAAEDKELGRNFYELVLKAIGEKK